VNSPSAIFAPISFPPSTLSGLINAGLPIPFFTRSSPFLANISETPKSHILAVDLSTVRRMFSGLICERTKRKNQLASFFISFRFAR